MPQSSEVDLPPTAPADPRLAAFCLPDSPEIFHSVCHRHQIWKEDSFDVQAIHSEAREAFEGLMQRATTPPGVDFGRILLLEGEAGSGKTHLMRAFRHYIHVNRLGYCGYMQMTSATNNYGRYVLANLVESLDQPYCEPSFERSSLMCLSDALVEAPGLPAGDVERLREEELGAMELARLTVGLADRIVGERRFSQLDNEFVRALLYLQCDAPHIRKRAIRYLRCEALNQFDREVLGDLTPRTEEHHPLETVEAFGKLMWAVQTGSLVLLVDQLEDMENLDDRPELVPVRFRRAVQTLCDIVGRVPSSVIVVSCLEDFYTRSRPHLPKPQLDRIENDPVPVRLSAFRSEQEICDLVGYRLDYLYGEAGAEVDPDDRTYPFPREELARLANLRTRDVLDWCRNFRERCIQIGGLPETGRTDGKPRGKPPESDGLAIEQTWNDFLAASSAEVPEEEAELAALATWAIENCGRELDTGHWFEAVPDGRFVAVERHAPDNSVDRRLVGICNRRAQGGGLGRQVEELIGRAGEHRGVIARSTEFPSNPKTKIAQQIGKFLVDGGRRVVIEDSHWRTMLALREFFQVSGGAAAYGQWLKSEKPLGRLRSLSDILDLDHLPHLEQRGLAMADPPPIQDKTREPAGPGPSHERGRVEAPLTSEVRLGVTNDRSARPLAIEAADFTRHAAFLGGTGSGKTTLALNVIEQLLARGIPAILVDRKGDLCGYAAQQWRQGPPGDPRAGERRALADRLDVQIYTPGNPQGNPLAIGLVPSGLGELPAFEQAQDADVAASALAGMMSYRNTGSDATRRAILSQAVRVLAQLDGQRNPSIEDLIDLVDSADPLLVNAIGRLDHKHFPKLVENLETLRLNRGQLLSGVGASLEMDLLLGLGRFAVPGKTRLSIVSTKFLGDNSAIEFFVARLLIECGRWAGKHPSPRLQAVLLFDEADMYLPAMRQPATKMPMENLLKRARSAGIGVMLATQSPGDMDYKCRENILSWLLGRIQQTTAIAKLKPMLSQFRGDVAGKLASQQTGEFQLVQNGEVVAFQADRSLLATQQLSDDEILRLARQ